MCGLAGMAAIGGDLSEGADSILQRMSRAVAHRGPDGQTMMRDGPVGLAFRRLALVGPENGDQPLHSEDGTVALIANGEVYNHRELEQRFPGLVLRTRSDCEILAHRYARHGLGFLDEVAGMFAVALWDKRHNRIVLARDRFGIKPLYYARLRDSIVFASEIKALFEHPDCPRQLDWDGALREETLTQSMVASTDPVTTWFRGIENVPAGAMVVIDLATGDTCTTSYWRLPSFADEADLSDTEFITRYRGLLESSVADCLSADTEVGLMLSGGVDSASVAALVRQAGHSVHTFTVLNGSTFHNGDAEFGHRVAMELGLPNHQVLFDVNRVPEVDEWRRLLWLLETPLCTAEQYLKHGLYAYAKQVRPGLRGMLLGQASDEYNGGYSAVLADGGGWPDFLNKASDIARGQALRAAPALARWWGIEGVDALLSDEVFGAAGADLRDPYATYVAWRHRTMQQYHCWHEDRTAAGNGVEARVPFLDHRIIELLATIPRARRANLLWDKRILREAVCDVLPAAMARRPKVSFYAHGEPGFTFRMLVQMLASEGGALVEEALAAPGADGVLSPAGIRSALPALARHPNPWPVERVLRLVNLGLLDSMVSALPAALIDRPRYEVMGPAPITDWDADASTVGVTMHRLPAPSPDDRVALGEDVVLVTPLGSPGVIYLCVGGTFEYLVDAADDHSWHTFLSSIDGERTLSEVLTSAGTSGAEVEATLRWALDEGVVVTTPPEPVSSHPAEGRLVSSTVGGA